MTNVYCQDSYALQLGLPRKRQAYTACTFLKSSFYGGPYNCN